jgi:hypothetical protein
MAGGRATHGAVAGMAEVSETKNLENPEPEKPGQVYLIERSVPRSTGKYIFSSKTIPDYGSYI